MHSVKKTALFVTLLYVFTSSMDFNSSSRDCKAIEISGWMGQVKPHVQHSVFKGRCHVLIFINFDAMVRDVIVGC